MGGTNEYFTGKNMFLNGKSELNSLEIGNMSEEPCILAVETSSRIGSVAIAIGDKILAENVFSGPMKHSSEIFPSILSLLDYAGKKPYQIEEVYISGGPGSFTGLRIAVALAKTLHLANNARIVQVDTLDVIASNLDDYYTDNMGAGGQYEKGRALIGRFATVLDAKRGQFYIAMYQHDKDKTDGEGSIFIKSYKKTLPDSLISSGEFMSRFVCEQEPIWMLGDGLVYNKDKFQAEGIDFLEQKYWSPHASKVHKLGRLMAKKSMFADPVNLTPFYLNRPEIVVKNR